MSPMGEILRAARHERGESLRRVAQAIGVSASFVSQIENGHTQPSVATLGSLLGHLGLGYDEVLQTSTVPTVSGTTVERPPEIQRSSNNLALELENGVRWERLAAHEKSGTAILAIYPPQSTNPVSNTFVRHEGTQHGVLIEGSLTLQLEFDTFDLAVGDSVAFDSMRPHRYVNHGNTTARGIWFHHKLGNLQSLQAQFSVHGDGALVSEVDVLRAFDRVRGSK